MPIVLSTGAGGGPQLAEARSHEIDSSKLRIDQQFGRSSVFIGDSVELSATFTNVSKEWHQGLWVDFYFVLENSSLVAAPPACSSGPVNGYLVLRCALGDLAPGQAVSTGYTVRTSQISKPWVVSTALVGSLQHDAFVNVVDDVSLDSDGDGISDYNEALAGTDPHDPDSVDRSKTVIDILALYTRDSQDAYAGQAEQRINRLFSISNQIYADSGVDIVLRPVHFAAIDYPQPSSMDTMLEQLTYKTHPAFANVEALRSTYGADLVVLFRPQREEVDRCGLANVGGYNTRGDFSSFDEKAFAYSLVAIDCPISSALVHEVGHNMGLTHSRREDGRGGTLPYATGYGVDSSFVTVMAYAGAFNTGQRLNLFSSPDLDCLGMPCGIDHRDQHQGADAVRALNLVRHQVGRYYPSRVAQLPERQLSSLSGQPTSARIASAASVDNGLSHVRRVAVGQQLSIMAQLQIDPRHVGQEGMFHVLVGSGSDYLPFTAQGLAEHAWDGREGSLLPFDQQPVVLNSLEYLQLINRLEVDPSLSGQQLEIFIAYRVPDSGELIFTLEPLLIEIVD